MKFQPGFLKILVCKPLTVGTLGMIAIKFTWNNLLAISHGEGKKIPVEKNHIILCEFSRGLCRFSVYDY